MIVELSFGFHQVASERNRRSCCPVAEVVAADYSAVTLGFARADFELQVERFVVLALVVLGSSTSVADYSEDSKRESSLALQLLVGIAARFEPEAEVAD